MVIKPMIRSNMCMNADPLGCFKEVEDQIRYVSSREGIPKSGNVLVIGASTGYGLASRITVAFAAQSNSFGVSFEREPSAKRTGTNGYYNTQSFEHLARKKGLIAEGLNADAFSHETKQESIQRIKDLFGKVDLVIYSLASPVRKDPDSDTIYRSVLKPIGNSYTAKSINPQTAEISEVTIEPASEAEIEETITVMGGHDWILWMKALAEGDVLSENVMSIAYSYIGPEVTSAVYREGTIGKAKEHLESSVQDINEILSPLNGRAYTSVNKAVVTRASAVIPVVPLYLALLFKSMKRQGRHEGCIEQMYRLFHSKLYANNLELDAEGRIRMDDWEMDESLQAEILNLWKRVDTANIAELGDLNEYKAEFLKIHGFGRSDINYEQDRSTELILP